MAISVRVKDVMDKNVVYIDASKNLNEAIELMLKHGVWSLVAVKNDFPVGVITERDIIRKCIRKLRDPSKVKVEEIMSSPLITIGPDEPIGKAMKLMAEKNIRRVYVVEKGKIIGRVTQTGAFRNMLDILIALTEITSTL